MGENLICYNRSCGKTFDPENNTSESCIHHPGVPVFHDAYKKWSCCDKKTTDFTEFLNIKGCTKSYHSNVKPIEPEKTNQNNKNELKDDEVSSYTPPQPLQKKKVTQRPDENTPLKKLKFTIGPSLKPLLEKIKENIHNEENKEKSAVDVGTPCHNLGCKAKYKGEESNMETCIHHCGTPIFHEGLKYWSCCVKKHTDFDSFLEQVGCTTGNHLWHKPKNPENKMNCRYDWHQTGSSVVISVFCKSSLPDLSSIEANAVKLKINIVFGNDQSVFCTEFPLFGIISVENSSVTYLGSKVEINLKKAEPLSWKELKCMSKELVAHKGDNALEQNKIDENVNSIGRSNFA